MFCFFWILFSELQTSHWILSCGVLLFSREWYPVEFYSVEYYCSPMSAIPLNYSVEYYCSPMSDIPLNYSMEYYCSPVSGIPLNFIPWSIIVLPWVSDILLNFILWSFMVLPWLTSCWILSCGVLVLSREWCLIEFYPMKFYCSPMSDILLNFILWSFIVLLWVAIILLNLQFDNLVFEFKFFAFKALYVSVIYQEDPQRRKCYRENSCDHSNDFPQETFSANSLASSMTPLCILPKHWSQKHTNSSTW